MAQCYQLTQAEYEARLALGWTANSGPHDTEDECNTACGTGPAMCGECLQSDLPEYYCFTMSGLTGINCAHANEFNRQIIMARNGACQWSWGHPLALQLSCGGYTVACKFIFPFLLYEARLVFFDYEGFGEGEYPLPHYSGGYVGWDCNSPIVMTRDHGTTDDMSMASGWPATITITPCNGIHTYTTQTDTLVGTINGSNTTFCMPDRIPITTATTVMLNGLPQLAGVGNDYTMDIYNRCVTFTNPPLPGDVLTITYQW